MAFVGLRAGTKVLVDGTLTYLAREGRLFRMQVDDYHKWLDGGWDEGSSIFVQEFAFFLAPFADYPAAAASIARGEVLPMGEPLMSEGAQ